MPNDVATPGNEPARPQNFQVDLGGVVDLLSRHIYSGPRVFLRELLQNAVDAITARREQDGATGTDTGHIRIRPLTDGPDARTTLSLTDDGIGLTSAEATELLATVGRTSKRDEFGLQRSGRLGQFGIGLLSCFMVADTITMVSRSAIRGAAAVRWQGHADGTFDLQELSAAETDALPVGTTVHLSPRPDERTLLTEDAVVRIAGEYGSYLPVEIRVEGVKHTTVSRSPVFSPDASRYLRLHAGSTRLGRAPFDVIDLSSDGDDSAGSADTEGVAYVLPSPQAPHMTRRHSVYVNRMLVDHGPSPVVPAWAFFVECEINSTRLSPTASREALVEDEALAATRDHVAQKIRSWLLDLGRRTPHRLREFTAIHDLALRSLCLSDPELADTVLGFITLETSRGRLPVEEIVQLCRDEGLGLRVAGSLDEFRQIRALGDNNGITGITVNGGYVHDDELAHLIPTVFDGVTVGPADLRESLDAMDVPPMEASDTASALAARVTAALDEVSVSGMVRVFTPTDSPAVVVMDAAAGAARDRDEARGSTTDQWAGILDTLDALDALDAADSTDSPDQTPAATRATGAGTSGPLSMLVLNWSNPLVRQLANAHDDAVVARTVRLLYVQALLAGRRPLGARERAMLTGSLSDLVALSIGPDVDSDW
ncbi:MAG TPA: HSP90 family protein [Candidatus Corynebacterium faecigallinarum]|uniref:HSP90 family protein n=1 Tax=Candidatus Corynebacterium faecigallinarum TaxID=2838528 RepID=A0A9D2QC94_9CORY|nr:HSP90 family protein [Candidatus Corynebacterium faecigallinarum]